MPRHYKILLILLAVLACGPDASAADYDFFGRSGDAIEIDLAKVPGIPAGAIFSNLQTPSRHTRLLSDTLVGSPFVSTGRFWLFPNNAANTPSLGDTDAAARGFQGKLTGSVLVNGVNKTFEITVRKDFTGNGRGQVGQSLEGLGRTNNPLFVAQQQQRLSYLGYVAEGNVAIPITGLFSASTDSALRTLQAALVGGVNTTQADVDGIIGPTTAGWLNAANAPQWERLVDPDPQTIPWSENRMIGNFDILPGRDPGTGQRTGNTPQFEDFATSWSLETIRQSSAAAKSLTGRTQLVNALSASDGYGSECCHNTHRAGMDIDLHVDDSTWNFGNGALSTEENIVVQHAVTFIDNAPPDARISRIITSNVDILNEIRRLRPTMSFFNDTSGGHQNHLHFDVGPPTLRADAAERRGDFNLDDVRDAGDIDLLRKNFNGNAAIYGLVAPTNVVDSADLNELVIGVLGTRFGDANLDRRVDSADGTQILGKLGAGQGQGWADGDFDGDGRVTAAADGSIVLENFGFGGSPAAALAALNPGEVVARFQQNSGRLLLAANAVSLLVLRSPGLDLGIVAPVDDFGGAAAIDQPTPQELAWLNFSDGLKGQIEVQLSANLAVSNLALFAQVVGGNLTPVAIMLVPEPGSLLIAVCGCSLIFLNLRPSSVSLGGKFDR
ncbi:MAG: hypothetical protein SH868_11800 [Bythopirellula sp.]|nr:hypothetical protein [Bythopirellula sp.]